MPIKNKISESELEVMKVFWTENTPLPSKKIVEILSQTKSWNPSTTRTLLKRLVDKGALSYETKGKGFIYKSILDREECLAKEREVISNIAKDHSHSFKETSPLELPPSFFNIKLNSEKKLRVMLNDIFPGTTPGVEKMWSKWLTEFEDNNNLKIEVLPWNEKLLLSPDIDMIEAPMFFNHKLKKDMLFRNLDPFIKRDDILNKDFKPAFLESVTVEKQIAALPFGAVVPCVIGSKALLKDFSLKSISHWYWDDFIKALPQASSSRKPPLNLSNLYNIIISHGFHFLEESSNNIKCLRKAIKTIEKLLPFSDVASKRLEWKNELKGQEHAFIFRYSSTQSELNELYPEKFICLPYPTGKTGKTDKITLGLFMSSVTEYPLECWELMKFLTAPKQQFDLWEKQLLIPAVDIDLSASTNPHSFLLENANQNQERLFEHNFLEMIELYLLAPEIMAIRNNTQNTETTIDRINFKSELLREMNDKNIQKYHQKVML